MARKIIHLDMDAFFAAVEQRDRPELRGKPVIVGGDPDGRGVVSTASYEARRFGIRSAMPAATARRLCPSGIFLRPRFEKYSVESERILAILRRHTDAVEPVSLDEAYLDVTHHHFGIQDPVVIAGMLKQSIHAATGLTASAGVAPNLFLAKIASDLKKPDGLCVVREGEEMDFLKDLSVRLIPGVGPVTEQELDRLGFRTCGELAKATLSFLYSHFGKWGATLFERAHGRDDRFVDPHWEPKQCSCEETFARDVLHLGWLEEKLAGFADTVYSELQKNGRSGRTVVLKVKYHDFELLTRSQTLPAEPSGPDVLHRIACQLLRNKTLAGRKPVRLLGLGVSGLRSTPDPQPDLFLTR